MNLLPTDVFKSPAAAEPDHFDTREKFIPLTRVALLEQICETERSAGGDAGVLRTFFEYLFIWRHHKYNDRLTELKDCYLPFSPDRDTLRVLQYSPEERTEKQRCLIRAASGLLERANYEPISRQELDKIFTRTSPYGLSLKVDLTEFDEMLLFRRGVDVETHERTGIAKLLLGKKITRVPVYKRLFLLLKLKAENERIKEIMVREGVSRPKAEKILNKLRAAIPGDRSGEYIYLKLFKNIPQDDLEMLFPNTKVKFKLFDKIKLGVTAGGGTIGSLTATLTKLAAIATNPIGAAMAFIGLLAVIFRQVMKFFNQRTEYMMTLAQRLYFHSLADNRGVLTLLTDRAGEEDVKEEMLLYYFLAIYPTTKRNLDDLKREIEKYLTQHFAVFIDFDMEDALGRLTADGLVYMDNDGRFASLAPMDACNILQSHWQNSLAETVRKLQDSEADQEL